MFITIILETHENIATFWLNELYNILRTYGKWCSWVLEWEFSIWRSNNTCIKSQLSEVDVDVGHDKEELEIDVQLKRRMNRKKKLFTLINQISSIRSLIQVLLDSEITTRRFFMVHSVQSICLIQKMVIIMYRSSSHLKI